jgi:hypothetical protein
MLSQVEIDSFVANGYVAVRDALPADVLQACQDEIWSELGDRGVQRRDTGARGGKCPGVRLLRRA